MSDYETLTSKTDESLMILLKEGNKECLNILISRYKDSLYRFIFSILRDEMVSEEVFQEVFFNIYKARNRYQPKAKFSTYLYKIAHNISLNELKKRKPFESIEDDIFEFKGKTPLQELLDQEKRKLFLLALSKLPIKYKTAYLLREVQGLNYEEISKILGSTLGTIKSRIARARSMLIEVLKKYGL
jgi:RNA polymerase sigma-70 factor, ECF subfamily